MKRIKMLFLIVSLLLILTAYNFEKPITDSKNDIKKDNIETIVTHASFINYEEENELFEDAELVVIANTNKKFEDREHVVKYVEQNNEDEKHLPKAIEDFYTKTPIEVVKVLKQHQKSTVSEKDELDIIEPISLIEDEGLKKLSTENYIEMQENNNYILYLKKNTYGQYGIINMNNGRFNLELDDGIKGISEHNHENDKEKHEQMKKSVLDRFKKEINDVNKED